MASIITSIDPLNLEAQVYSSQDTNLISSQIVPSQFDPTKNYIEYNIFSSDGSFSLSYSNYLAFSVDQNTAPSSASVLYDINIDPERDLTTRGFSEGEWNTIYRFLNNEISSSAEAPIYYIKEISSDRTEIRLGTNAINNIDLKSIIDGFENKLNSTPYFQDFYLNFGGNNLIIANNILIDDAKPQYEILVNLYDPLPSRYNIKTTLWVVTEVADSLAFNVQFTPEPIVFNIDNPTISGPNYDLNIKDKINNSSNYIDYSQLLSTGFLSSYQQIASYLNENSINISIDYTDFSDFVHFSSATTRVENFYYKVQLIEQYNSSITNGLVPAAASASLSSSISILENKINNLIENFDGYEYFLYFSSESGAYPKGTTNPPYSLQSSTSGPVLSWYTDLLESASLYDRDNPDYLSNTIPDYLKDDPQNEPYSVFINMIGQHYDNIWIYYKDVTNRYNGDNRLDYGISKDLVSDALRSFGLKIYQNNFSTDDLFNAFAGYNFLPSGSPGSNLIDDGNVYVVNPYIVESLSEGPFGYFVDDVNYLPSSTELITNYVSASKKALYTPTDDITKEIYKRLYHNLPLLLKQKGTTTGLRNLINVYGIPDTILRISEFGGRDTEVTTYDYFYDRYSYAFKTRYNSIVASQWQPLTKNYLESGAYIVPDCIQFRFKTDGIPISNSYSNTGLPNPYTQSLMMKTMADVNDGQPLSSNVSPDFGIILVYSGSSTTNYQGSTDPYAEYGQLRFYISGNIADGGYVFSSPISLPFFDGGWWSVMLQRDQHPGVDTNNLNTTYSLYVANKTYDSNEGNVIGYIASSSIYVNGTTKSSVNEAWNKNLYSSFGIDRCLYLSHYSKIDIGGYIQLPYRRVFLGSYQELKYYTRALSESQFIDYTMNPGSIEGLTYTGSLSSFNTLAYRAPLGNLLENQYTSSTAAINSSSFNSFHPSITGSANILTTSSFIRSGSASTTSSRSFIVYGAMLPSAFTSQSYVEPNIETYYFNQPIVGLKNRTNDKIQVISSSYPAINLQYTQSGNTLSQYRSIEQQYLSQYSEIPDVNALEVAFSPQNEVDDDIISSLGYFNIGEYIGDPRFVSSPYTTYPDLTKLGEDYFKKYYSRYDLFDYIRLIKFFDNSLFKMIKDFVPARTNLRSGVVVKPHLLERNRYPQPQVDQENVTLTGSVYSQQVWDSELEDTRIVTSLIETISGSTGGTFNEFNKLSTLQTNYPFVISGSFDPVAYAASPTDAQNYFQISSSNTYITTYYPTDAVKWDFNKGTLTTYFDGTIKLFYSASTTNLVAYAFSSSFSRPGAPLNAVFNSGNWFTNCSYGEEFFIRMYDFTFAIDTSVKMTFGLQEIYPYSEQSWGESTLGPSGSTVYGRVDQREFYNGELSGSIIKASNGELNSANEFKYPLTNDILYKVIFYRKDITPASSFTNILTSPNPGEIYVYYDTGSYNPI